jgi:hypothetical protein
MLRTLTSTRCETPAVRILERADCETVRPESTEGAFVHGGRRWQGSARDIRNDWAGSILGIQASYGASFGYRRDTPKITNLCHRADSPTPGTILECPGGGAGLTATNTNVRTDRPRLQTQPWGKSWSHNEPAGYIRRSCGVSGAAHHRVTELSRLGVSDQHVDKTITATQVLHP